MIDPPSDRAEEIFCDALEQESDAAQLSFAKQACAGDEPLFEEVMKMLSAYSGGERLFDEIQPTSFSVVEFTRSLDQELLVGSDVSTAEDEEIGKQVGTYRLVRKIGEGGGGNVYLAEQDVPVHRQVALKIIKSGMDSRSVIARFEVERQVLAMMEHPNIARVFDAGTTPEGRPYFVMELVHGTPITTYCEEQELDISRRLELFIQTCHAIQHAHQKGIIHRDIKPSNILIEQLEGLVIPKVIDFGIAKATGEQLETDRTAITVFQPFVGTPAYMSPEQADMAEMDIDVRSDIYSLGVLLYELLTGMTPFNQKKLIRSGLEEMRRTIREREPPRPSARLADLSPADQAQSAAGRHLSVQRLLQVLEGDLDWIIMKALEKEPERRYRSADGFADDIQRYLNHEPVMARPPSRAYRFRKMVRRNKVVFASGAVVIAVLVLSSSISTWLLVQQKVAERRAELAEQEKGSLQQSTENLARALVLFRRGEMEQADALLDGIKNPSASPGNASMYRDVGDWHALSGRWEQAKARFDVLLHINEFEGADSTMDDSRSAALLVEQEYMEDYERFRESLINRYAGTESPTIAQRVIREALLVPANDELMRALTQYASVAERPFSIDEEDRSTLGWHAYSLALWSYRYGDYEGCFHWVEETDPTGSDFPTRALSVRLIQSAALWQLGRCDEARIELESVKASMNDVLSGRSESSGTQWVGYWFDQSMLRIHLREAEALVEGNSGIPQ